MSKLVVDDFPFSIDDFLEVLGALKSNFSIVSLCFMLELNIHDRNFRVFEALWLLFKSSVGECLTEAHTFDEEGVSDGAAGDFLDSNVLLVHVFVEVHDGVDDHVSEELFVFVNNFGVERGHCALNEKVALFCLIFVTNLNGDFFDAVSAKLQGFTVALDNNLGVHSIVNELLGLLEKLASGKHDGCSSITDLIVLRFSDIDEGLGSRVHNIEESDEGGSVVRDSHASSIVDKFVHASGA